MQKIGISKDVLHIIYTLSISFFVDTQIDLLYKMHKMSQFNANKQGKLSCDY